jgi:hypothetical protein
MTEQECRIEWQQEARAQTLETLPAFLAKLAAYPHDYGTICVAIGAAAIGAAWALERSPSGGITGFQAGAVQWEFIRHWDASGAGDNPQKLLNYGNLLYPQYADYFTTLSPETWAWAQEEAKRQIAKAEANGGIAGRVREHWESIASGNIPFGLSVETA